MSLPAGRQGFSDPSSRAVGSLRGAVGYRLLKIASVVKRISSLPSKQLFQVRVLADAQWYNGYMKEASIPKEVLQIAEILKSDGYSAYLVGGCVRDVVIGREPNDWDVATDAVPETVLALFPDSVYENDFGTVGVKTESEEATLKIIEVTTFRTEESYSDKRRPDKVHFAKTIEEDLSRRDFTVNAMALPLVGKNKDLVDPYGGQEDLKNRIIRAVGDADGRFNEDALRLMRAVRFSAMLGFDIEEGTKEAVKNNAGLLSHIAKERVRDELTKMLMSERAGDGIEMMRETGLLEQVIPELLEGVDCEQNMHHIYSVYEHNLKSLEYAVEKKYSLVVRLASLLHDVGKPNSRRWKATPVGGKTKGDEKGDYTFYGHQVVGERMVRKILERLKFSSDVIEQVALLVREHMFVYDPEAVTLAGVRRLLARIGVDQVDNLMKVREADRIGSGVPKAQPYRLRHLQAMFEKVKTDPVSAKMLKVNGGILIKELGMEPSPRMGQIISALLEEVLDEPGKNTLEYLLGRAKELGELTDEELKNLKKQAQARAQAEQDRIDEEIKKKYFVS